MKCALIIPAWQPEELFPAKTSSSQLNYWQPLGTLYVAASLKEAGHEVEFFNGAFMGHDEIMARLEDYSPGLVGLYSTTFGWPKALKTAAAIKAVNQKTFICVGGPYPIAVKSSCLQDNMDVDAVVMGEAEITLPLLAKHIENSLPLNNIAGLAYRDEGEIVQNALGVINEDLDKIPFPARELLHDARDYIPPPATYRRKPVAVMITARGCDRRCIFCSQIDKKRESGVRGIRFRSVENVLAEIEMCLQQGYREIKFIDDTLAADYDRLMTLTQEIKRRKLDFTWFASACVNQVDKPLLQAMKDAGCWAILFGAESGVQKNLNTLRKGSTLQHTRDAVKAAKQVGLSVTTSFIFGIPGETYEDALKTIDFAIELGADTANFHAITPFPGTPLYDNLNKYGHVSDDLSDFTYQGAAFVPFGLTREQVHSLRQLAFRRFYSRPSFLFHRILKLRHKNEWRAAAHGLKSLFWIWWEKDIFNRQKTATKQVN